ncbi:hypothetical protein MF271_10170 [Deinococcus sp. KNUC1210]|uniref:hypothetical protein n=1 Tax=Deinococcus sp. KNUC1210 TaxID=2917691 RepID=UPI001EF0A851|nr:hypothetical protein [Deinococcus sp. KNUC1210]ULH14405.1 hypothetical protein MF271_10170 [Deinococcus sp. KNUC1210]
MRPVFAALVGFLALSHATAADLSGIITDYLLNKVSPTTTSIVGPKQNPLAVTEVQTKVWQNPKGLNADELDFMYMYKISKDAWTFFIKNPRLPLSEYMGTTKIIPKGKRFVSASSKDFMSVYLIDGGRFKGYLAQDGVLQGKRIITLLTPLLAQSSPNTAKYLK